VRARASGVPFTEQFASVAELKNGKVIRQHEYLDHTEALEAAGVRE
jgi:ketosteroid isomerase-like protein